VAWTVLNPTATLYQASYQARSRPDRSCYEANYLLMILYHWI
jgi:hypothetical protein